MKDLTNPITDNLTPDNLVNDRQLIGYEVLVDGKNICLAPVFDSAGFGAAPGETVRVLALGLETEGVVQRRLKGYKSHYQDERI